MGGWGFSLPWGVWCLFAVSSDIFRYLYYKRSSVLKTLIREQLNVCPPLRATSFGDCFCCFQLLVAKIKKWLKKHQCISCNYYTRAYFFHFLIFSKLGFCNVLLICKCLLWLCFSSTVWSAFQLKINRESQLVLKFSSIWADVAIVCLTETFTLKDTIWVWK